MQDKVFVLMLRALFESSEGGGVDEGVELCGHGELHFTLVSQSHPTLALDATGLVLVLIVLPQGITLVCSYS